MRPRLMGMVAKIDALFMSTSTWPKRSRVLATIWFADASSETSTCTDMEPASLSFARSPATFSAASPSMSATTTRDPDLVKPSQ